MGLTALIESGMEATAATELLLNVVWTIVGAILVYFMQACIFRLNCAFVPNQRINVLE